MKKKLLNLIVLVSLIVVPFRINAQLGDVTKILNGGVADANKLMEAYMNPFGKGFALGLANGWYNTAQPHKLLGFDLTFTATAAMIPTKDQNYDAASLGLTTLHYNSNESTIGQTVAGKKTDGPELKLQTTVNNPLTNKSEIVDIQKFKMPQGFNLPLVPSVMVQLGVGLPFGTEVMVRFLPQMKIGSFGKIGLWGLGLKHDIKQWIPVISEVPLWSLSAMIGYTSFKTSATDTFLIPHGSEYNLTGVNMANYNGQGVELSASALTINILASTNIPIINVYGGLGYTSASSNLKLTGVYPLPNPASDQEVIAALAAGGKVPLPKVKNSEKDPINVTFKSASGMRANIGVRLKLLLITLHADATYSAGYLLYTGGFGFSFR
jgi:hypothetical protein